MSYSKEEILHRRKNRAAIAKAEKTQNIKNKVECMNSVATFINSFQAEIQALLLNPKLKFKNDGMPHSKNYDVIMEAIEKATKDNKIHARLNFRTYSICLEVSKDFDQVGANCSTSIDTTVWLITRDNGDVVYAGDTLKEQAFITCEEYTEGLEKITAIKIAQDDLRAQLSSINSQLAL